MCICQHIESTVYEFNIYHSSFRVDKLIWSSKVIITLYTYCLYWQHRECYVMIYGDSKYHIGPLTFSSRSNKGKISWNVFYLKVLLSLFYCDFVTYTTVTRYNHLNTICSSKKKSIKNYYVIFMTNILRTITAKWQPDANGVLRCHSFLLKDLFKIIQGGNILNKSFILRQFFSFVVEPPQLPSQLILCQYLVTNPSCHVFLFFSVITQCKHFIWGLKSV